MKKILIILYLLSNLCVAQKLRMVSGKDNLSFIDYESDKKWIEKMNTYNLSDSEKKQSRINIKENFEYANSISNVLIGYNDIIEDYIKKYTSYSWLPKSYGLLNFYEPLFEAKLREYGLPSDLKYLPIVESNMNPVAGSWVGASGLWQFMPATGAQYGLAKSSRINLFYDPFSSTDAACKYLLRLYKMFGDWNLVLSAYNSGEGRVLGAIRKAGTKNYWEVRKHLPNETKAYAPSFHAVRFIGKMYGLYYNRLPRLRYNYSDVKEITVRSNVSFQQIAMSNKIDLQTLYFLNPHIVTEIIPAGAFLYYVK